VSTNPKLVAARKARTAEVTGEPVTFPYDGDEYTIDGEVLKSLDVLEDMEEGRVIASMKTILGPDQWATFRRSHHSADDLGKLYEAASDALGITGN
jgi:gamma-glutamylcyclotransferase (GGCT)/AIG2-like uncharacterized protein YtfP